MAVAGLGSRGRAFAQFSATRLTPPIDAAVTGAAYLAPFASSLYFAAQNGTNNTLYSFNSLIGVAAPVPAAAGLQNPRFMIACNSR